MTQEETKTVTFVWPHADRTGIVRMEWKPGWTVKHYLHAQPLRSHSLLGMWKRCKAVNANRRRVKLYYIPQPNDSIVLTRAARPMS